MKDQQWRRDPDSYGFLREMQPRYADIDFQRHVNNVSVYGMHAEAGMLFQSHLLGDDAWQAAEHFLHPVRAETDFLAITHYQGPVLCGVRLIGVDEYQCTLATALFQSGACVSVQEQRLALWRDGSPQAIPEVVRLAMLAHQDGLEIPVSSSSASPSVIAPAIDAYPAVSAAVAPRVSDFDADRCTSAVALMRYTEQAIGLGLASAFPHTAFDPLSGPVGLLVARIGIDIVGRRRSKGEIRLAAGVSRLGNASITLRTGVFDRLGCLAVCDNVLVFSHRHDGRIVPMPQELRDYLLEHGQVAV